MKLDLLIWSPRESGHLLSVPTVTLPARFCCTQQRCREGNEEIET